MCYRLFWYTVLLEMTEIYHGFVVSTLFSFRCSKAKYVYSIAFGIAFALLFILVSLSYWCPILSYRLDRFSRREYECEQFSNSENEIKGCIAGNDIEGCIDAKEIKGCIDGNDIHGCIDENNINDKLLVKPYIIEYNAINSRNIPPSFLPETSDIEISEDLVRLDDIPTIFGKKVYKSSGTEQEALTAVNMALKMKKLLKFEKAQKLFQHAIALQPLHPDILNHYGEFLEEKENDIIKADHLYVRALTVSPQHSRALVNRKRTLPVVDELDEQELEKIDRKRVQLIQLNRNNPSLKRVKKEIYFQHIYHTVAIEGNTMTLAETRMVVETRMSVPGKSVTEHNEILGLESALRYINKTLVSKDVITVFDILEVHKRVLGHVDPIEAGSFRQTQVFVGEHIPPMASNVAFLMEEFCEWLQSASIQQLHPVKQAALAHHKLVYIHPFVDGNGRTARLLMNIILMRNGYPPVIIRKQDRAMYYNAIQLANEGDARPFVRFIAHATECTLNVYLHAREYGAKCLMQEYSKTGLQYIKNDYNDIIPL